ncbi:hypothetical protein C2845_PM04G25040 [Panicum miliaceum]|uniref:DUF1618 domain-containing protein n=1 Tax=Panicum miliaceum TaxID=4540 RepID=A0A3L6QRM1_PANMI|nr:hypothetical protein C2845_PM04G25040 [Panicum miliaceum]
MELEFAQSELKLEWSIFDQRLNHIQGVVPCSSTAAATDTSTGQNVCVSLRLVPPPLSSYVEIHTDGSFSFYGQPMIIAAHGDLVLIYGAIAVEGVRASSCPGNFFLYKASPALPWLIRLPPPSPGNCWRGRAEFTGVLHKGGDDFIVANLQALVGAQGEEVAELFRYSSGSGEWDFFQIDMPGDAANGFHPQSWYTDTVFSHDSFMYWVDYHQGLISADICAERPHLQFIKLPGIETKVDFMEGRGLPEILRTAAVNGGRIWFVDVDDGRFRSRWSSTSPSSVTAWFRWSSSPDWVVSPC